MATLLKGMHQQIYGGEPPFMLTWRREWARTFVRFRHASR
jgi:hypothetical protein